MWQFFEAFHGLGMVFPPVWRNRAVLKGSQELNFARREHPRPIHKPVRVSRSYDYEGVHAPTSSCFESIRLPEHPRPYHNHVRVSRAYAYQSIQPPSIISCFESIRLPEHIPRPNHNPVRVSRAYAYHGIHAPTIISFVLREHTITRAYSMRQP